MTRKALDGLLVALVLLVAAATGVAFALRPVEGPPEPTTTRVRDRDATPEPPEKTSPGKDPRQPPPLAEGVETTRRLYSTSDELQNLASLPYAERSFDAESKKRGVTIHDPTKASPGLNFYSSRDLPAAFLLDMEGHLVHQWRRRHGKWQHVTLLPDGDVLALVKGEKLVRVDARSNVIWTYRGDVHHDLWRSDDGTIHLLTRKSEWHPEIHSRHPILVDYITVLDDDGNLLREHSVLELFQGSDHAFLLPSIEHRTWSRDDEMAPEKVELDFLHTNHVEVFDGSLEALFPPYRKGNVLLSLRHLNTIAIADLERGEIVWIWGPTNLTKQHHPTLLENGNLLIFDNGRSMSRVIELDPRSREIVWYYGDDPDFFTSSRGSNVRLPNGNTLITESDPGYVFEVTPEGETVWEFANPRVNDEQERAAIWRMERFTEDELPFLVDLPPRESNR